MGLDDIAAISLPTRGRKGWPSHRFCCFANFDLRTRAGDGLPVARRAFHFRHFNPHTCLWGSLLMSGPGRGCNHFGSCPPCGITSEAPCRADFSPLALREGRYAPEMRDRSCISNCAPAWGRLQNRLDKMAKSRLSSTHPCGGGPGGLSRPPILAAFQSTSPRRVRRCREFFDLAAAVIQTPAPARGATVAHQTTFSLSIYCNPRARAGCDLTRFVHQKEGAHISIRARLHPIRPLSPTCVPARKEGPGQIAPGPLETVGPAYFTILATSAARSSSLFSMPSPFSKRANLTMEMLPPSSFATWAVYLATVRSWSLTKGCSSRQTSL